MIDTVTVQLNGRSYDVRIGSGLLNDAGRETAPFLSRKTIPVVADHQAKMHHGARLENSLMAAGHSIAWFVPEQGENGKSWDSLRTLTDWLLNLGIDRNDHIIAFGGGVVGDLTGFAASILKRGCKFIQISTTLLAQVDSSVGGKTAINASAGKNMIGAFHQPSLVLADLDCLATLPERELRAGFAEVIKYGILGDSAFFAWCEENGEDVLNDDIEAQLHAVTTSVRAKARIVAEDERETTGRRALLNLGHTFGHAFEAQTGFSQQLLHGEAVALGMVLAARFSARLGKLSQADAERISRATETAGLPSEIAALGLKTTGRTLTDHMRHDKKASGGRIPFLLLNGIGAAYLDKNVDLADVAAFLDEQLQAH